MKLYYSQDNIIVRRSIKSDINSMKDRLRKSDVEEIYASHHFTPEQAIKTAVDKAIFSCTIQNGSPIGIFGINTDNVLGNKATIFMLATDDLDKIKRRFIRHSRRFVDMMLDFYPYLENYVHIKNHKSISWLKYLRANIEEPQPYGIEGQLFHKFSFSRDVTQKGRK